MHRRGSVKFGVEAHAKNLQLQAIRILSSLLFSYVWPCALKPSKQVCEQNFISFLNNKCTLCGHTRTHALTHNIYVVICALGSLAFLRVFLETHCVSMWNLDTYMLLKKHECSGLDSDHCRGWGLSSSWRTQILRTSFWVVWTVTGMMESLPTFGKMMSCR